MEHLFFQDETFQEKTREKWFVKRKMDDRVTKTMSLFHSQMRTVAALSSFSLALFAFLDKANHLHDLVMKMSVSMVIVFIVWFSFTADSQYTTAIRALESNGVPEHDVSAMKAWRIAPVFVVVVHAMISFVILTGK